MTRQHIEVVERTSAGPATVYALLRDGASWPAWSPIEEFALEREGDGEPEGLGAVRVFRNGRITGHDQITALVEDRTFGYRHTSRLPVRDYRGEVALLPAGDGGTVIHWRVSFLPTIPGTGWLLRRGLAGFIGRCARGLAGHAGG